MIILNNKISDFDVPIKNEYINMCISNHDLNSSNGKKKSNVRKKRVGVGFFVWSIVFCVLLFVMGGSLYKLLKWNKDNLVTKSVIEEIDYDYIEVQDSENTEYVSKEETSDYWYYVKFPLISVDFSELVKKNSDTVAWINVNNTNINYPVVQASDNDYYLNRSYDKSYNEAGWVFMDYRNNNNLDNKNTILYAHSRLDKTMFGSLSKTLKSDWYTNKDNHIIRISTPEENALYQIFSVYVIEEESYYINTNFSTSEEYLVFLNRLRNRSKYNFNTNLSVDDKILTLSTCYSDTERTVVHAKLLKRELR